MLTEFHFDEFYLACDELNGDNANFVHGKIIDLWKDYGCLIYPHSKKREYLEWLGESDPRITNLWRIAFSHFRSCDMGGVYKPVNECKNPNEVEIGCTSDNIDLVLVPNDTVIFEDEIYKSGNVEIVKTKGIIHSNTFNKSIELSQRDIKDGESLDSILEERFKKLIKNTKKITIIDRYWAKNHEQDINVRKPALQKILEYIYTINKTVSFVIYSSNEGSNDCYRTTLNNYLELTLKRSANFIKYISYFEISVCDDSLFKPKGHDRYIAFDDKVCSLGRGIAIFRAFPVQNCTLNIKNITFTPFSNILAEFSKNREVVITHSSV